jgi:hypothetical protein
MIIRGIGILTLLGTLVVGAPVVRATEVGKTRNLGIGFQSGSRTPTAIVGKVFLLDGNAIDLGVGFRGYGCSDRASKSYQCSGDSDLSLHGDFLWQQSILRERVDLDWHIGAGGRLYLEDRGTYDNFALAARMPVGVDLTFDRPNFVELFVELTPSLFVFPSVNFGIDGSLGVRFYF